METRDGARGTAKKPRGCNLGFFPEESFQSWANYGRALRQTGERLRDRITARSQDHTELNEVRARSGHEMKRNLAWWDLMWFGVGTVVGAGIFVLTGQEAHEEAGPAVVVSYAISGVAAMLAVLCYTEFAVEIPVAGGSFAYLRVELGDFVAFIAAGNILLEYVIGNAAVARSWTSYFATLIKHQANDLRIYVPALAAGYNRLDPIAVAIIVAVSLAAVLSTKGSSRFNYIACILHAIIVVFIVAAGLTKANPKNLSDFAPFGVRGIFAASAVLFFAYIGFDAVSTMAEETKNPSRDIPVGLIGAMTIATVSYCLLALTLCLMQHYSKIDVDAPFSIAFRYAGMAWAEYVVAFGAIKGMTTSILTSAIAQARYLTHIARTHMAPPCLARVHGSTGTPINATVVLMAATAAIAFFTDLGILSNLLSISTLFIFILVAVALLIRRYYLTGETSNADRNKLVISILLILGSSIAVAVYWAVGGEGWVGYVVAVPLWGAATAYLWLGVPQARAPKVWGVPMMPWVPSASIAIDCFLLASIDGPSFARFGVWTALLLVYYLFFGLHASYDTAKASASTGDPANAGENGYGVSQGN